MAGAASFEVKAAPFGGGAFTTLFQGKPQGGGSEPASVDLARYAGSSIRLRLEAREGTGEAQWGGADHRRGQPAAGAGVSAGERQLQAAGNGGWLRSAPLARLARPARRSGGIPVRRAPAVLPRAASARGGRCPGGVARLQRTAGNARGAGERAPARAAPLPQLGGRVRRDERDVGGARCAARARVARECAGRRSPGSSSTWRVSRREPGARRPRASTAVRAM